MQIPPLPDNLLRANELAKLLGCGKSTVYQLAKLGKIPSYSIGKLGVRFNLTAVLEALHRPAGKDCE